LVVLFSVFARAVFLANTDVYIMLHLYWGVYAQYLQSKMPHFMRVGLYVMHILRNCLENSHKQK